MKFRIRFATQVTGVFIIFALVFTLSLIIFMGINQRWFARDYYYYSLFDDASGLSPGMAISFKGFTIGKVQTVALEENDKVRIDFSIYDSYIDKVFEHSGLILASSPIGLGGGLVFYQAKNETEPQAEGTLIPNLNSKEGRDLIISGKIKLPKGSDQISRIITTVESTIEDIEPILENVNVTLNEVNTLLAHVNGAMAGDSENPIGLLLMDLAKIVSDIERTSSGLDSDIAVVINNVDSILKDVNELTTTISDPQGLVPKLLGDTDPDNERLFNEIMTIVEGVNKAVKELMGFTEFINTTQPQITSILEEGREAITTGQDVLEGVSNNPLISGGITESVDQATTTESYRDEDF